MGKLLQDLRYGARMLVKNPGFALVVILTLALGIGVNTTIFSVVNAVLLRPLPYEDANRLMTAWGSKDMGPQKRTAVSYPDFADWRDQTQSFEQLAVYNSSGTLLRNEGGEPELIVGANASADIFQMLRIKPALGRAFTREEDQPKKAPIMLISYNLWQRRFNSDPNIIGQTIPTGTSGGTTVIGVLPQGFRFPAHAAKTDFLRPIAPALGERAQARSSYSLPVIGRLKPNVSRAQAVSEMKTIGRQLEAQYPDEGLRLGLSLVSVHEDLVGSVRLSLLLLLGAVGFVLLIACANVANLLLARAASRQKEIAIRTALGASRMRVLRQLLTESTMLALVGGTLGLLLSLWGVDLLIAATPVDVPRVKEIGLDASVFFFTLGVSLLTGIIFGLAPALFSSRIDLNETLKEGGRTGSEGARRNRVRSMLVVSEVALSFVLLVGAGLLIKSFLRLREVNPGFEPQKILTTDLSLSRVKYPKQEQQVAIFQQAAENIRTLPGVEAVALVDPLPLSGNGSGNTFQIAGRPLAAPGSQPNSNMRHVSEDYFRTMGIPLLKGRGFNDRDNTNSPAVLVVNDTLARTYFPNEDAVGQRIIIERDPTIDPNPPAREIVGVVGDVRHEGLDKEAGAEFYVPYLQEPSSFMSVVVRTATDKPETLAPNVRERIRQVDKDLYVQRVTPMTELLAESFASRRFNMMLVGLFAAVALLLASVGIFSVMSFLVTQRTHEIGIRMALGAQARDVLKMVLKQGMFFILIGLGVGLVAAFALTRVMGGLLFKVRATDPLTFVGVSLLLIAVALIACYIPARRATRVDPMRALHYE
jgi:predicted permease